MVGGYNTHHEISFLSEEVLSVNYTEPVGTDSAVLLELVNKKKDCEVERGGGECLLSVVYSTGKLL